ncbi:cytochrome P450 [Nocardia aurantiaca]|uniref:Cytochrome P450 n=1 Tax=Nocardia aurantiaca TaxID=2675850 RepID=A0A6I3L5S9_9NOCA|nr:cytochrome P450 [Nocardia aurantiaca]MTE16708.1 cytochrome P450 [Nocardia aurantiaca]
MATPNTASGLGIPTKSACPVTHEGAHGGGATPATHSPSKRFPTLRSTASALYKGWGFEDGIYARLAGHDFSCFRVGFRRFVAVTRPEYVEHILFEHPDRYYKSIDFTAVDGALGVGIFSDNGDSWKHHRKILNPMFTRKHLESVFDLMAAPVEDAAAALPQQPAEIEMHDIMVELTLDVIGNAIFYQNFKRYFPDDLGWWITEGLTETMQLARFLMVAEPPAWVNKLFWGVIHSRVPVPPPLSNLQKSARMVLGGVDAIIADRAADPTDTPDLINLMLKCIDDGTMTPERVRSEATVHMLAGHETTATTMSFLWHLLSQNHWARDRMLEEVDTVLEGRTPTAADLRNLRWTAACIDETMRLYPPVWFSPRKAIVDDVIGGHRVKAGTTVIMPAFLIGRDPRWWPNPDVFDPSRFMPGADAGRNRGAFAPFSGGPRTCIGRNLALMETVLIAAKFSQTHTFETVPGHRMEPQATPSLRPRYGLRVIASPRR